MDDTISRAAAITEIMEDLNDRSLHDDPGTPEDYAEGYDEGIRNAAAIVLQMPSAQPVAKDINVPIKDCISRQAAIDALDEIEAEVADGYGYQYAKWREYFAKMQSAQLAPDQNGDLWITVPDIDEVTCVYVQESKSKFCRIFYEERI